MFNSPPDLLPILPFVSQQMSRVRPLPDRLADVLQPYLPTSTFAASMPLPPTPAAATVATSCPTASHGSRPNGHITLPKYALLRAFEEAGRAGARPKKTAEPSRKGGGAETRNVVSSPSSLGKKTLNSLAKAIEVRKPGPWSREHFSVLPCCPSNAPPPKACAPDLFRGFRSVTRVGRLEQLLALP